MKESTEQKQVREITEKLEAGIHELFMSERYKEYLRIMSKFHNYSLRNTILIAMQNPDASLVAGYNTWKKNFNRHVKHGEKGIRILAPAPYKIKRESEKIDPITQKTVVGKDGKPVMEIKEITIPAFKVVSVFDVSQTEGKELPDIAVELTGDVDRYKDFFAALEKTSPVPIGFEKIEGGAHGYYHLEDKRIAIAEGMSELQTLKTAIHEIAHAKLHDIDLNAPKEEQSPRVDSRTREVEAESVAYTVCQYYGLDTSDYSFGYVAGWSSGRELSELKSSLETIRSAAAEIINSIDGHIAELQKAQDKEQTAETVYQVRRNPYSDSRENSYILQEYVFIQGSPTAKMGNALYIGTMEKCRELMGQLKSSELTEGQVKELYTQAQDKEQTAETVYQVRRNPYSDSRENSYILQEYVFIQGSPTAKVGDALYIGTMEKCRELMGQLKSGELTGGQIKEFYTQAQEIVAHREKEKPSIRSKLHALKANVEQGQDPLAWEKSARTKKNELEV